ncbi:MAG: VacJ family lipoprotein [Nitrospirota bacterium]
MRKALLTIALPFVLCTQVLLAHAQDPVADASALTDGTAGSVAEDSGAAGTDLDEDLFSEPELVVRDPFERVNRAIFTFNDKLYFYVLKPVARVFRKVPEPVRVSVGNFFSNLAAPIRVANNTLQGKIGPAGGELMRFIINTTIGIGGLFDPAKRYAGIPQFQEDFGQTLGRYGLGAGPYLVLPVLGPSNVRDGVGWVVDRFLDPLTYVVDDREYWAAKGSDAVNTTSLDKDTYEGIKRDELDPYLFIRDAYAQRRIGKIEK